MNKTFCSKLKDHELRKDRIRSANFCLPLYKVVSYHLNFGIKQISPLPGATDKPCGEGVRMLTQNCC